jgi:hypothetical protein
MTDALRTYQVYAGLTFLGYEYANKENLVVEKTMRKFGSPALWGVDEYTVKLIEYQEEPSV